LFGRREWNGMERKGMKRIILEYSFLVWEFIWREWKVHFLT